MLAWQPGSLGRLQLNNRLFRAATYVGRAGDDGSVAAGLVDFYSRLAEQGLGLLVTGITYVKQREILKPRQKGIYSDHLVPGLRSLTDAVHDKGGKIFAQLAHGGAQAVPHLNHRNPRGPMAMVADGNRVEAISAFEIEKLVQDYGAAARRARDAGFDGIQIHLANHYGLSQFLSPAYNRRDDQYGLKGSGELILKVYQACRANTGVDFPIIVKANSEEFYSHKLTREWILNLLKPLAQHGLNGVELRRGMGLSQQAGQGKKEAPADTACSRPATTARN